LSWDCQRLSWDCQKLSEIVVRLSEVVRDCREIVRDCQRLSEIVRDCRPTRRDCQRLSEIVRDCQKLSEIVVRLSEIVGVAHPSGPWGLASKSDRVIPRLGQDAHCGERCAGLPIDPDIGVRIILVYPCWLDLDVACVGPSPRGPILSGAKGAKPTRVGRGPRGPGLSLKAFNMTLSMFGLYCWSEVSFRTNKYTVSRRL